jgi:hypothetical protein
MDARAKIEGREDGEECCVEAGEGIGEVRGEGAGCVVGWGGGGEEVC